MSAKKSRCKVVVIGGGTGVFSALSGLKECALDLTAVVTMADDGGSTGMLREEFGILPPGDIRRALLALSRSENQTLRELFSYRFKEGSGLHGHSFGNLMLTALERITGSFEGAIAAASKILECEGRAVPVTLSQPKLFAELENGQVIAGETNIDIPSHDGNLKIRRVWLKPRARINPTLTRVLLAADAIVIGPGDLYTSIVPNLLVSGVPEAIKKSKAKKIYVANLMTKFGETNGFRAKDFVDIVEGYLGRDVLDYVLVNTKRPQRERLKKYALEKAAFVEFDEAPMKSKPLPVCADLLRPRGFLRHDPAKLAKVIVSLL